MGCEINIPADQLPKLGKDEYYWAELIGLEVFTNGGESLGVVDHLLETGANDVLVLKGDRERLIPYVMGQVIKSIDLDKRQMNVDWDADF